jgi:flagella basal body P-ring formation protein FlgA
MMLSATLLAASATASAAGASPVVDPVCSIALAEVVRAAAAQGWEAEARCVGRAKVPPSPGASLSVQQLAAEGPLRGGPLTLLVRTDEPGRASVAHRIALRVTWRTPAWIATRALGVGESLMPDDTRVAMHRWIDGVEVRAAAEQPPQGRLKRAVRAGEVVLEEALVSADGVLRGDRLEVVLSSSGVEIRTPVTLLAHARVGERVRVQALGRADVLDGLLVDRNTVKMEGP